MITVLVLAFSLLANFIVNSSIAGYRDEDRDDVSIDFSSNYPERKYITQTFKSDTDTVFLPPFPDNHYLKRTNGVSDQTMNKFLSKARVLKGKDDDTGSNNNKNVFIEPPLRFGKK
ncbi:hypothetical protein HELRODRAFT_183212 [Helobdella robusta]|uniref:Uncharacterized protein n=1 Tax=Helobdella robusta TaxID=6412 RepID=T1FJB5_HELRO|nr:hypothetical protein HELRODRAFT_183212 [Helobdella robusta]ESO11426.1 hypothetical protein HELRODRAFT_183212 [Helobdella robusta]